MPLLRENSYFFHIAIKIDSLFLLTLYYPQVCGGGPKLTMWNLKSLVNTAVLDTPRNVQQNVVKFVGNEVDFIIKFISNLLL